MRLCYRFPLRWHLRGVEGPTERALAADALRGRGTPTSCRQGAAYDAAIFPSRVFSADFLTSQDGHENSSMHLRCRWTWSGSQPSAYDYGMPGGLSPNVSCPISGPAIYFRVEKMVGVAGFEPATPTSRTWCATRRDYTDRNPSVRRSSDPSQSRRAFSLAAQCSQSQAVARPHLPIPFPTAIFWEGLALWGLLSC